MRSDSEFTLRLATEADIHALRALIESSVRGLQANDYTPAQIESALGTVLGVDTQLIADRTYFLAESSDRKRLAGCGGWSKRKALFGADSGPVRQVLRGNPYETVKTGFSVMTGRRITLRDALLVVQTSICAILVTSSMVAVHGLVRSLHSNFGFEPRNAMLAGVDLSMTGFTGEKIPAVQRRMIEAMQTIHGVEAAGLVNGYPPLAYDAGGTVSVFKQETGDLKQANVALSPYRMTSPEATLQRYLRLHYRAPNTGLLSNALHSRGE